MSHFPHEPCSIAHLHLHWTLCAGFAAHASSVNAVSEACSPPYVSFCCAGLYGNHLPVTTGNFKRAVEKGLFTGTIFHKILPGSFIQVLCCMALL